MYEHAASFTCYELWRGADIRYLSEWSEDRSLGESQRSFCQCHLSSRLGTKEVGASVPLPPSCAPLNLHNKVPCYIRGESRTPRANGGILCQTEASLNPQWGDGRTHLPFPGESRLASAPLPPHKVPPPSLPLSLSISPRVSSVSFSALFRSPSWSRSVCTLTRLLTRSGMHSYPRWLKHPQTHKHMQITHTGDKLLPAFFEEHFSWIYLLATKWNMCFCVVFLL